MNTNDGLVFLAPGEERDLNVSPGELKSLSEDWFRVGKVSKAEADKAKEEEAAAASEAERKAKAEAEAAAKAAGQ